MTLLEATESTKDRVKRRDDREVFDQEECMKRTEKLHNQNKARERDARKAKKEAVANVAGQDALRGPVSVLPIA